MESGLVHVARMKQSMVFPAKFMLVAAMNPCPCGYYGDTEHECRCSAYEVIKYQKKISGPFLDRIDLQIKVKKVALEGLRSQNKNSAESPKIKTKIAVARHIQRRTALKNFPMAGSLLPMPILSARQIENTAHQTRLPCG